MVKKRKIRNYLGRNFQRKNLKDKLSEEKRSALMSKIRSKETKLEIEFIKLLKKETKYRFLTHQRSIKGNPDIVFKSKKICVFIDSDFWHGWQFPRWKNTLKNDFWRDKINNNRTRDRKTTAYLRRNGWKVIRIWEHGIKKNKAIGLKKITDSMKNG
ncbi:MAG: Vsr domain protein T:G mismatch repair endonuclease [Candidatus Moranbacteria bacterium GW2011_GWE2_35_2-]|nr:MAG: Vsr domain protein T:G mismatch repair endonuclease [Candidatus Moranbacteria bacterium GW2011_GWE2_35_2-]KKQ03958.1 MAG: Vsr domain protein T:G mismatch repair endonuclease [Candidatus Moranbacteria bacterium GW2011_GWF1_36_4]KKQ22444.1 MAG: Vsr domain protein T:G mismatch repair endonuclease [Candidatus Moranbacteria bacterium GW2011_GWF2_37_11]KKQ29513.1 MAG: Vsr domain protein T:G mismatch repair endonuclease [Candidatus Moranbacteria bacterium GW2011_GWD1_37_17]KKQ30617.1 MAG: Vsr 